MSLEKKQEEKRDENKEINKYFTKDQQVAIRGAIIESMKGSFATTGVVVPDVLLTTQAMKVANAILLEASMKLMRAKVFTKIATGSTKKTKKDVK